MAKTIRFADLVKSSGRPEVATLWADPKEDAEFVKAIRENRVMTVRQEPTGNRKDYGKIGFQKEKNVSYFVFPKPLPQADGERVIGIKYELTEAAEVHDPATIQPRRSKKRVSPKPVKVEKKYSVLVRRTAAWELTVAVSAENKEDARTRAEALLKKETFRMADAVVNNEIRDISVES